MSGIYCCRRFQTASVYQIVPSLKNICEEYILYLEKCTHCGYSSLEIIRFNTWGEKMPTTRLKQSKIKSFLNSMNVIWTPKNLNFSSKNYGKFNLSFNEYGKKKKCYQNLSNLKLGLIETDPLINIQLYKRDKENVRSGKQF